MGINVRLFGPFSCMVDDAPLPPLRSRRGYLLLASLVLRAGRPVSREALMDSLWPESDTKSGQENLRRTLTDLRKALGTEAHRVVSDGHQSIRFILDDAVFVDVLRFDAFAGRWEKIGDLDAAAEAIDLYRGPLLEGFDADWIPGERAAREEPCREMLESLARRALEMGDATRAVTLTRRAERLGPLNAVTQRLLYESFAATGDIPAAKRAFREFRDRLHRETNQAPDAETQTFVTRLDKNKKESLVSATRSDAETRNALPAFLTSFVGRREEISAVAERLSEAGVRLLTLTGVGGIGKTRLAVEAAREGREAAFADLSALPADAAEETLFGSILMALGGKPEAEASPRQSVAALLNRPLLLILDNAEHLIPAVSRVAQGLLKDSPHCQILATSRRPLSVPGEVLWPVAPHDEAVVLFAERARAACPDFVLTDASREIVAHLCRRLDNLPLAIELAAARLRVLPLEKIAERLAERFTLLAGGSLVVPERQRTLRGALEWSYTLLTDNEKRLFAALSVFVGGATLEAIEAISPQVAQAEETLFRLIDHSLVVPGERFRLLETVREFAAERLTASSVGKAVQARFCDGCIALALAGEAHLWGTERGAWITRLEAERENFQAAIRGAERETALRLCMALGNFWNQRGYYRDGVALLTLALSKTSTVKDKPNHALEASLRGWLGAFQGKLGEPADAESAYREAIALCRASGNAIQQADMLNALGGLSVHRGKLAAARACYEEALALCRERGDAGRTAIFLRQMGTMHYYEGDFAAAQTLFEEALAQFRVLHGVYDSLVTLWWLGFALQSHSDYDAATARFEQCLTLTRESGDRTMELAAAQSLADVARDRGDFVKARERYAATLPLAEEMGDRYKEAVAWRGMSEASRGLNDPDAARNYCRHALNRVARAAPLLQLEILSEAAAVAAFVGKAADAARLYGYVDAARTVHGIAVPIAVRARHVRDAASLREALGESEYADLQKIGEQMTDAQALALAQ